MAADTFVSKSDYAYSNVRFSVRKLLKLVKRCIKAGDGEVIVRKDGVRVVSFHDHYAMSRIRMHVSAISAQTYVRYDYFSDAEIIMGDPF